MPSKESGSNKTAVLGLVQRGGDVITAVVLDQKAKTLMPKIIGHVKPGSWVSSDEYNVYKRLSRFGYVHRAVNDSMEESVDDDTHTNTIEGLWSHLKCSVRGTDRAMSPKHMMECLGEFEYRFNCRFDVARNLMFDRLIAAF